eukprot:365743-Chlamydomonas_euryale.AAC.22
MQPRHMRMCKCACMRVACKTHGTQDDQPAVGSVAHLISATMSAAAVTLRTPRMTFAPRPVGIGEAAWHAGLTAVTV